MTLIVALACRDAVVLATDGQMTEMQGPNVASAIRHGTQKIKQLGPHMLWAASGMVSVIQAIEDDLNAWADQDASRLSLPPKRMKPALIKTIAEAQKATYGSWHPVPGQQSVPPATQVVVCGHTGETKWILEVSENGVGEFKYGFSSLGSAFNLAAVAAAMVSEYSAESRSLVGGRLLALRILETAVQAAALSVGGEPMLGVVDRSGATILERDEIKQLQDQVSQWKTLEAETLDEFTQPPEEAMVPDPASETP